MRSLLSIRTELPLFIYLFLHAIDIRHSSFAIHYSPFAVCSTQFNSLMVVTTMDDSTTQLHVSPSPMENSIPLVNMPRGTYTIAFSSLNGHWFLLLCTTSLDIVHWFIGFLNIVETIL